MSSVEDKLNNLLEVLKHIDLDFNWLLAITSLSAQEIAIKWMLDSLGESYGEVDFQKLADKLIETMERRELEPPLILLSIIRAYRHIRAKIIHDPHKTRLNIDEADAIFTNTVALIKVLSEKETKQINISKFIDSIDRLSVDQNAIEFSNFSEAVKKQIFEAIMDTMSLRDLKVIKVYEGLFDFLKTALKNESSDIALQNELFAILLRRTLIGVSPLKLENLLDIIAEFTRLSHIKELIKERELINPIIADYESSHSFIIASYNAQIILNLASLLNKDQIIRVVNAALSNDQITNSFGARSSLNRFLSLYSDKIPKDKKEQLLEAFK